jgi:hypothetical protein
MQVKAIVHRVKGFYRLADYALRWGMIAPDAQRRLEILGFWRHHGLAATGEAFKVSRRTLYLWRAKLKAEGGNDPLDRNVGADIGHGGEGDGRLVAYGPADRRIDGFYSTPSRNGRMRVAAA